MKSWLVRSTILILKNPDLQQVSDSYKKSGYIWGKKLTEASAIR